MRSRKTLSRIALLGVVALVAVMLMAVPGNATFAKKYDLSVIQGQSIAAGTTQNFTLKYTNKSLYKIGSTVLKVPTGFQIVVAPPSVTTTRGSIDSVTPTTVKVKNLNLSLGSSFTISGKATVPCGVGSGSWSAETMTGSTFTGDSFTYNNAESFRTTTVTPCSLAFTSPSQPTNIGLNDEIDPPVTVQALNGAGALVGGVPVTLTANVPDALEGDTSNDTASGPAGPATFSDLSFNAVGSYTLTASSTSPGYGTDTSEGFTVAGEFLSCPGEGINTYSTESNLAAESVDLVRQTGACQQDIAVTIVVRENEVEIQKEPIVGSAFTMSITWEEESLQYPLPATQIAYFGEETPHPMQQCLPDDPEDGDTYPDLPPRVDGPPGNEFWCVTSLAVEELEVEGVPTGEIRVTEGYFGAGDPRVTRG